MLAAGGLCFFLSGEVCLRLYKQTKKVLDPDLDNITNPHEVKHWMDPRLIPFGWGLFDVDDEIIVIEKGEIKELYGHLKIICSSFRTRGFGDSNGSHGNERTFFFI